MDYFGDNKIRYILAVGFVLGLMSSCVAQFRAMGVAISTMSEGRIPFWMAGLYLLSVYATSAVSALIALAVSFYACAIYPVVTIFIWKRGTYAGSIAGMIGSLVGVVITNFIVKTPLGIHPGVWGLIVGFACYLVVSLCTKPIPEEKRDIFMEPLRRTRVHSKTKLD